MVLFIYFLTISISTLVNLGLDGTCEQIRNGEMEEGDSYVITYDPSAQSPRQVRSDAILYNIL